MCDAFFFILLLPNAVLIELVLQTLPAAVLQNSVKDSELKPMFLFRSDADASYCFSVNTIFLRGRLILNLLV